MACFIANYIWKFQCVQQDRENDWKEKQTNLVSRQVNGHFEPATGWFDAQQQPSTLSSFPVVFVGNRTCHVQFSSFLFNFLAHTQFEIRSWFPFHKEMSDKHELHIKFDETLAWTDTSTHRHINTPTQSSFTLVQTQSLTKVIRLWIWFRFPVEMFQQEQFNV